MTEEIENRLSKLGTRIADVEERFIRGSNRSEQKINKTSSCVWLRHVPSGVQVRCQRERSQTVNRELAWTELCTKLEEQKRAATALQQDEREKNRRRHRKKSRAQKVRMIESKKHRATIKARRGHAAAE